MTWPFTVKILLAHLLGDFVLQTDRVAAEKRRTGVLLLHGGIHALLLVAVGATEPATPVLWATLAALAMLHFVIDAATMRMAAPGWWRLALDQGLHALALGGAAWFVAPAELVALVRYAGAALAAPQIPIIAVGLLVAVGVGQVLVGLWVEPFAAAIQNAGVGKPGLHRAGRWIGVFERTLIFVAILVRMEALVGFVIAAKAVIRLPEARDPGARELAEYYLVGTLASASWAVLTAVIARAILGGQGG